MIGQTINNYLLERKLGEGGMGDVYFARHNRIDRVVAIKILHKNLFDNNSIRTRFKNEANALIKLGHTNIVRIYDYVEQEGFACLIMEYIEGFTLDEYISKITGPIPAQKATHIMCNVLEAVQYAHDNNIFHRDIKPGNIMVSKDGMVVRIMDFSIAKFAESSNLKTTHANTQLGTPFYMSPEHIKGMPYSALSDIYSLGVTLFEMVTGKCPYQEVTNLFELQSKIVNEPLPPTGKYYPNVTGKLQDAIVIATKKDLNQRFKSCNEFKAYLLEEEQVRPVIAPAPIPVKKTPVPVPVKTTPAPIPVKKTPPPIPEKKTPPPIPVKKTPPPIPVKKPDIQQPKPLPVDSEPAYPPDIFGKKKKIKSWMYVLGFVSIAVIGFIVYSFVIKSGGPGRKPEPQEAVRNIAREADSIISLREKIEPAIILDATARNQLKENLVEPVTNYDSLLIRSILDVAFTKKTVSDLSTTPLIPPPGSDRIINDIVNKNLSNGLVFTVNDKANIKRRPNFMENCNCASFDYKDANSESLYRVTVFYQKGKSDYVYSGNNSKIIPATPTNPPCPAESKIRKDLLSRKDLCTYYRPNDILRSSSCSFSEDGEECNTKATLRMDDGREYKVSMDYKTTNFELISIPVCDLITNGKVISPLTQLVDSAKKKSGKDPVPPVVQVVKPSNLPTKQMINDAFKRNLSKNGITKNVNYTDNTKITDISINMNPNYLDKFKSRVSYVITFKYDGVNCSSKIIYYNNGEEYYTYYTINPQ
jgi:serine/threonine protein kinase